MLAHIAIALVCLAFAIWLAGKLLPKDRGETTERPMRVSRRDSEADYPAGGIIDQERDFHAPYGGRRL